jgi:transposase
MGGPGPIKIDRPRLHELVTAHPDAALKELRAMLGVQCSESAICMALKKLGFSSKTRRSMPPSRIAPMSPSDARNGNARNLSTMCVV